ncbi:hypothetical protein, partial [Phytoactinopolyspora halotolerans]
QFLSRDSYTGALADLNLTTSPWNNNRYAYTGGNPISYIELDGHARTCAGMSVDCAGGITETPPNPIGTSGGAGGSSGGGESGTSSDNDGIGLSDIAGFAKGFGEQGLEELQGLYAAHNCLNRDYQTCSNIGAGAQAIANDPTLLWQPIEDDWRAGNQGEAAGRGGFIILSIIAGTRGTTAATKPTGALRPTDDLVSASSAAASSTKIYSSRVLRRMADEPGPNHNFPTSFDETIFSQGTRTVVPDYFNKAKPNLSNDSVQYRMSGALNGRTGVYEIFTRPSMSGRTELIMHRFFRPDPR